MVRQGALIKQCGIGCIPEMIIQICMDYNGLPDVRTLTMGEIVFFYSGITGSLIKQWEDRQKNGGK